MPKRLSRPKRPRDINQLAHQFVDRSTHDKSEAKVVSPEVSRVMSEMGRKGGKVSAKRRMKTLTPEQRRQIAFNAAKARWAKKR